MIILFTVFRVTSLGAVKRDDVENFVLASRSRPFGLGSSVEKRRTEFYLTNLLDLVERLGEDEMFSGKDVIDYRGCCGSQ